MNILVILGHPDKGSFNHAIANTVIETLASNGHEVLFHDLYRKNLIRSSQVRKSLKALL
jgi:NAD(P)H dehydrogenase (quinone)